jgi:hypothetical protein
MADISVTAASVIKGTGAQTGRGIAGASIAAGKTLYADTSDSGKLKLADANAASPAFIVAGIALHAAESGQPIEYQSGGNLTFNAVLTAGTIYVLSATAGGIAPASDLASGHKVVLLGVATSTTNLEMALNNSGATV